MVASSRGDTHEAADRFHRNKLDPDVKPLFVVNHPSYPAAHGFNSTAEATVLGYLFLRDAAALDALAAEAAESRVWAGIHYRSDIAAGRALGRAVAEKVNRTRATGWFAIELRI